MTYRMCDPDNRDDLGNAYEVEVERLEYLIDYINGPLRGDVPSELGQEALDAAVLACRAEDLHIARRNLRRVGVYLSEASDDIEEVER